ncbi:hypothetical protein CR513_30020, partial [Mucuna pruriens]
MKSYELNPGTTSQEEQPLVTKPKPMMRRIILHHDHNKKPLAKERLICVIKWKKITWEDLDGGDIHSVIPKSFKGVALSWYTRLPPNFVDSFETLVEKFKDQYATSQPHHLTSVALVNLR